MSLTLYPADSSVTPTPGSAVVRDASGNAFANNFVPNFKTQATAAGTTVLVVSSSAVQEFTGSTTQIVTLPVTSTLAVGLAFCIVNKSTGAVTVNSSGGNLVQVLQPGSTGFFTCNAVTGTTASSWDVLYFVNGIPQNSQITGYTTTFLDANGSVLHPTADNNPRTFTIDSNANVPYNIGTAITFINQINTVTIAITSDTLVLAGAGTTGSRTLAANGIATALKVAATTWIISGNGIT